MDRRGDNKIRKPHPAAMIRAAVRDLCTDCPDYMSCYKRVRDALALHRSTKSMDIRIVANEYRKLKGYASMRIIPYLAVKDVADRLGLSVVTIRKLAPSVPGAYRNSSGWQIPAEALDKPPLRPGSRPKPGPRKRDR